MFWQAPSSFLGHLKTIQESIEKTTHVSSALSFSLSLSLSLSLSHTHTHTHTHTLSLTLSHLHSFTNTQNTNAFTHSFCDTRMHTRFHSHTLVHSPSHFLSSFNRSKKTLIVEIPNSRISLNAKRKHKPTFSLFYFPSSLTVFSQSLCSCLPLPPSAPSLLRTTVVAQS